MTVEEILSEVSEIFIDVLDNEEITLSMDSTANDIEEWDSLSHIMLIVAIEKHFKIKFSSVEINGFKNVGELCKTVHSKMA